MKRYYAPAAALLASAVLLATACLTSADGHLGDMAPAKKGKPCSSASPCLTENNTGSGAGLLGEATSGNALEGEATTGSGVYGSSTGSGAAVYGTNSSSGSGIYGYSVTGSGVNAQSHEGYALSAYSSLDNGVFGQSGASESAGVLGYSAASGGFGLLGQGGSASSIPIIAFGATSGDGATLISAEDSFGDPVMQLSDTGNLGITGEIYTGGSCHNGCSDTRRAVSYAAQSSAPTLDDVGEGTLLDGHARVPIDAAFSNVMDATRPYVVLLTPEGDASLYVTNRTSHGFEVAQVGGGHASIPFAYRIVAHPYGRNDARLPFVTNRKMRAPKRPGR